MNTINNNAIRRLAAVLVMMLAVVAGNAKTRIACVGNSITYGSGIDNREKNGYPGQLNALLGPDYEVANFGICGATVLSKGDLPYISTAEYEQSKKFNPDIVLIKLGTNDAKPQNRVYFQEFAADYRSLIDSYRHLPGKPRVILLTPTRCFLPSGAKIDSMFISSKIVPATRQVAYTNDLEVIDLHSLFGDKLDKELLPDRLHPSAKGAGLMAQKIYEYLSNTTGQEPQIPEFANDSQIGNFNGYKELRFRLNGVDCRIAMPRHQADGKPWVMRARFWGHEPQNDIALLERGFHIAYCDVAGLYGSPEAVKRWNSFYEKMAQAGFSRKVVLEGMSRGGLIVYNWAKENPEKVACIYADAPVMKLSSWPLGHGRGRGSKADTERMRNAYSFQTDEDIVNFSDTNIEEIANAMAVHAIAILHVVGDADSVVPYDENTKLLENEMLKRGKPIKVIHKPGAEHHPHSLQNPEAIYRFILEAVKAQ